MYMAAKDVSLGPRTRCSVSRNCAHGRCGSSYGSSHFPCRRTHKLLEDLPSSHHGVCPQEGHGESSTIHATFNQRVGQLAEASEEYHREGVSFVRGLLDPNPDTRLTAEEALKHPFLAGDFPDVPPDLIPTLVEEPPPKLKNTMDRMLWEACVRIAKESS
jgi:serine/threonine protein kinase